MVDTTTIELREGRQTWVRHPGHLHGMESLEAKECVEQQVDAPELAKKILDELRDWKMAARGGGSLQRFVRD